MKKSIKNTIMIGMAAVLIGTSAVTISYAKEGKGANAFSPPSFSQQFDGEQGGNPFENFSRNGDSQSGGFDKNKMPDNQQNGNSQQPQPPSNQQDSDSSQQPQAPGSSNESSTESSSSSTNTSLSIDSLASEDASAQTAQKNMPSNNFRGSSIGAISALCYLFAALQIAIILAIIAYLIISKFNDVSFNEVLANMRKGNKQA